MPRPSSQVLAYEEHGEHLYLLLRPIQRHGKQPGESSWWRKTLNQDEFVEMPDKPVTPRKTLARIKPCTHK